MCLKYKIGHFDDPKQPHVFSIPVELVERLALCHPVVYWSVVAPQSVVGVDCEVVSHPAQLLHAELQYNRIYPTTKSINLSVVTLQ